MTSCIYLLFTKLFYVLFVSSSISVLYGSALSQDSQNYVWLGETVDNIFIYNLTILDMEYCYLCIKYASFRV